MTKEERPDPVASFENDYFAVINEHGTIQYANDKLIRSLHIEKNGEWQGQFFDFLSPACFTTLKEALQCAGYAANPAQINMNLLNSRIHKTAWHISKLKTSGKMPALYFCIGQESENEKPTNKKGSFELANAPAFGILVQDVNGNVIDANDKAAALLNTNPLSLTKKSRLAGFSRTLKTLARLISFENYPPMNDLLSGKMQEQVVELNHGGESKWLLFTSYPLFDDSQSVPFSIITLIKELTQQEARQKNEKELFRKEFLNITSAMTWLIEADSEQLIFANPAFLRFLGMSENDLNKKAPEVIPAHFTSVFEKEHRAVLATGIAHKKIYKLPLADGRNNYYLVNIFLVPNNLNKQLLGGEAFDITFGYNIHEEIAQANERLIRLTQVTSEAIWEWDLQTEQVFRNKPLQDLIGFNEKEMKGLSWWFNRVHPEDRKRVEMGITNALHNKLGSWYAEYRFQYADGQFRTVRDRGYVVYEKDTPVKMIGSILDVTEIKELENQLMQEKIKHQKERARSIIDAQEKERTKLGQELHDNVNQLLMVSKLYLGLLKPTDPEKQQIVARIMESLTTAISDIQTISRDMVLPKLKEKTLSDSIQQLVTDIKMTCPFDIHFIHDQQPVDNICEGKKIALYRILQEQLKNIIQYSKAHDVTIQLRSNAEAIYLIISDDGVGFDPLTKTKGIGLRNIYDRALLYNGKAELISSPGAGCSLKITIPRV